MGSRYSVRKVKDGYVVTRQYNGGPIMVDSGVIRDRDRAIQIAGQKQRGERIHQGP